MDRRNMLAENMDWLGPGYKRKRLVIRIWPFSLRCHRITMVQAAKSRRGLLVVDFTKSKSTLCEAIPKIDGNLAETNLYDALLDTIQRMKPITGKKSVLIIGTGGDSFSKASYDETLRKVSESGATIFCIGTGRIIASYLASHGIQYDAKVMVNNPEEHLWGLAQATGGSSWFPNSDAELAGIFHEVTTFISRQYVISYAAPDKSLDSLQRKTKVELIAPDGNAIGIVDQQNKKVAFIIRSGESHPGPGLDFVPPSVATIPADVRQGQDSGSGVAGIVSAIMQGAAAGTSGQPASGGAAVSADAGVQPTQDSARNGGTGVNSSPVRFQNSCIQISQTVNDPKNVVQPAVKVSWKNVCSFYIAAKFCALHTEGTWQCGTFTVGPSGQEFGSMEDFYVQHPAGRYQWWAIPNGNEWDLPPNPK